MFVSFSVLPVSLKMRKKLGYLKRLMIKLKIIIYNKNNNYRQRMKVWSNLLFLVIFLILLNRV